MTGSIGRHGAGGRGRTVAMVVLALALTGCVGETQRLVFPPAVRGALLHAKTAVVDGVWSTVGSANMDWRSFLHNDEINVVVLGEGFGREMTTLFEADVAHSVPIDAAAWARRGIANRSKERIARLLEYWL